MSNISGQGSQGGHSNRSDSGNGNGGSNHSNGGEEPTHGFSLPDADFDPWNNEAIRRYYTEKQKKGVLNDEDGIEDDVETEARQVVENWEKVVGRQATTEERVRMMAKIRRIRAGAWLEGLKTKLVGETTVPIAYFNRLYAENERTIAFVSYRMAEIAEERKKMTEENRKLRDENQKLAAAENERTKREEDAKYLDNKTVENLTQLQEENDRLRDELAKGGKQSSDDDECKEKVERLESELRLLNRQSRYRAERMETLEQQLKESRQRENGVRDEMRDQDREMRKMTETIDELTTKINGLERDAVANSDKRKKLEKELHDERREVDNLKYDVAEQENQIVKWVEENDELRDTLKDLRRQLGENEGDPAPGGPNNNNFNAARIFKELREAKEQNRAVSADVDALIDRWMAGVADANNLREYHAAVQEYKNDARALQDRILALYTALGYTDTNTNTDTGADVVVTGEQALRAMEDEVAKQPKENMKQRVWALKLATELQLAGVKLRTAQLKAQTLEMRLADRKSDEERAQETRLRYGMHEDREVERRVDEQTQMYRMHRREMLDNIFGAAEDLRVAALRCPHEPTRARIGEIIDEHLNVTKLPKPKVEPSRR